MSIVVENVISREDVASYFRFFRKSTMISLTNRKIRLILGTVLVNWLNSPRANWSTHLNSKKITIDPV